MPPAVPPKPVPEPRAEADSITVRRQRAELAEPPRVAIGEVLVGRYRIDAIVDRTRGLLLDAQHLHFDQRVAIRVLPAVLAQGDAVDRFQREVRTLAKLQSEHVARIHDVGVLGDGSLFLVREHLEGPSLSAYSAEHGGMPIDEALTVFLQICEAVQEAHAAGVILRDLPAAQVVLTRRRSGEPHAKLADLGTCKLLAAGRERATAAEELSCTALVGLSTSAAPELVRQDASFDLRSDVWSLGCLLYQLLTGQAPFEGEGLELMLAVTRAEPPPPSERRRGVPPVLDRVIATALAKDRRNRYESVHAMARALAAVAPLAGRLLIERIGKLAGVNPAAAPKPAAAPSAARVADDEACTAVRAVPRRPSAVPPLASGAPRSAPPRASSAPRSAPPRASSVPPPLPRRASSVPPPPAPQRAPSQAPMALRPSPAPQRGTLAPVTVPAAPPLPAPLPASPAPPSAGPDFSAASGARPQPRGPQPTTDRPAPPRRRAAVASVGAALVLVSLLVVTATVMAGREAHETGPTLRVALAVLSSAPGASTSTGPAAVRSPQSPAARPAARPAAEPPQALPRAAPPSPPPVAEQPPSAKPFRSASAESAPVAATASAPNRLVAKRAGPPATSRSRVARAPAPPRPACRGGRQFLPLLAQRQLERKRERLRQERERLRQEHEALLARLRSSRA